MKNTINIILIIFTILISLSCAKLKNNAKDVVSEKLHNYTNYAVSNLVKNGINHSLPVEITKIMPVLKQFGLKTSIQDLDKKISKLTVQPVIVAEKLIHHVIDEMTLIDAIKLITVPKSKIPMTKFVQNKSENIVNNKIKNELDKVLFKDVTINRLKNSIKTYSKLNKNVNADISSHVSKIVTNEIFKYMAQTEKSDK